MKKIEILDCTLRDGGYYTNWDFHPETVITYFKSFNKLPVDYLEIGYRSLPQKGYLGEYFYCPDYVIENARELSEKKLAIMLNEKDVRPEDVSPLLRSARGKIDMIRLAIDPANYSRAIALAHEVRKLGFRIGFNVMHMSKWKSNPAFLRNLSQVNDVADYFYMVDSYGGVYPNEVIDIITTVKNAITCPLGFHGHNNMEMSLINSLTAMEHGASMIDATITGMGRGAGNLKTELLLTALNSNQGLEVDFNALSDLTHLFEDLQEKHQWGTRLPYMVSAANSLPQKEVMDWVGKRFYNYNSIIRALHNQKKGVKDNLRFENFIPDRKYDEVIIIGGGPSIALHTKAILEFILKKTEIAIIHSSARNGLFFKDIQRQQYFCLAGNEGTRLAKTFKDLGNFRGLCLLPVYPRRMGTHVPEEVKIRTRELDKAEFGGSLADTHTALALQAAFQLGAGTVYLAGYDGYSQALVSTREMEIFNENETLFARYKKFSSVPLVSITPTLYNELTPDSVYAKI